MKKYVSWLLVALVLLPVGLVSAQGDPGQQQVALPDGTTITLPGGWQFKNEGEIYHFDQDENHSLVVYLPSVTATYYGVFKRTPTPSELLVYIYTNILKTTIDKDAIKLRDDGAEYAFKKEANQALGAVITWGDGLLFYQFFAPARDYEAVSAIVDGILAQLPVPPAAGATPAPGETSAQPTPTAPADRTPVPPVDTALVPSSGTWTMAAASEFLMRCQGGGTVRVPNSFAPLRTSVNLSVSGGGAAVTLSDSSGSIPFAQGEPGVYTFSGAPEAGMFSRFSLHVAGPASMSGEILIGFTDMPCAGTIPITFQYQG